MEIEYLHREDFSGYGEAVVRFTKCGAVIINHIAMKQLGFCCGERVLIGYDKKNPCDFVILKSSSEGWVLRGGNHGEGIFNSVGLVKHVIGATWGRRSHVPSENKPCSMSFGVAKLPVDDGKNKNVYALLRKKE
ncbi:MAG: hypothetical protein ABSA76_02330 [Bacteroidales bacterium]